jgi:hypothetical protein
MDWCLAFFALSFAIETGALDNVMTRLEAVEARLKIEEAKKPILNNLERRIKLIEEQTGPKRYPRCEILILKPGKTKEEALAKRPDIDAKTQTFV